ncbi:NHLP bacteriocin system secretion protein [Azospirillaceae bacterium]
MFREVSLKHLSSPEQLDEAMCVTTPIGWLALTTLGALIITALVLSIVGAVPERISGKGILISPGGVVDVISSTQGQITHFLVKPGDWIESGQIVANTAQPEIESELKEAQAELAQARVHFEKFIEFQKKDFALQMDAIYSTRTQLNQQKKFLTDRVHWLSERDVIEEGLLKKGLTEARRVIENKISINNAKEALANGEKQIKQLTLDEEKMTLNREKGESEQKEHIAIIERKVKKLAEKLYRNVNIVSPYSGHIVEFKVNDGEVVDNGRVLFSMLPQSRRGVQGEKSVRTVDDLMVKLYVKPEDGKKITAGMAAQVSPSTVKREEYGFIEGVVTSVAPIPSTEEGIQRMLKNRQLVQELTGGGAPFEVSVQLNLDPRSHNGYKWSSSSSGPWIDIHPGTLAEATITIRHIRLITLLIPAFERLFENHSL